VLALDRPPGSRYVLTSGVVRHRDLAVLMDELTGLHPRRSFVGASTVRQVAWLNDLTGGRLSPLPKRDALDWMLDNAPAVDTTRATTELGLAFRPLRETVADAIRWWAEHDSIDRRLAGRLAPPAR
jgi:hypothetical protein